MEAFATPSRLTEAREHRSAVRSLAFNVLQNFLVLPRFSDANYFIGIH